jgi:hypothetical protein
MDCQKGVILQLEAWEGLVTPDHKTHHLMKCCSDSRLGQIIWNALNI